MKNEYKIIDDVVYVSANCKGEILEFLLDRRGLEKAKEFPNTWFIEQDKDYNFYVMIVYKRKTIRLHRFLLDVDDPKIHVDHIDGNGLNNTYNNIRECTCAENQQNRQSARRDNQSSGVRGVHFHKQQQKWRARIRLNGKEISGGYYDTIEEAEQAVIRLRQTHMPYSTT